jgi:hypothetical protein
MRTARLFLAQAGLLFVSIDLALALQNMSGKLNAMMRQVLDSSEQVARSSQEITGARRNSPKEHRARHQPLRKPALRWRS